MKTVVIGLGNTLLRDDGVGVYTARLVRERLGDAADVVEAELAGINLVEMLNGYDRAYIIDAIQLRGEEPGTVFRLSPDDLRIPPRLASYHDIDLQSALALGERLGLRMPREVVIFAVQVEDTLTIEEGCLPAVKSVIYPLVDEIEGEITGGGAERISIPLGRRRCRNGA